MKHSYTATQKANKPHITIFGRCNAGKSTLLNFITATEAAIVSPIGGTTTDAVRRAYEIRGFGPVVLTDTAGIDDTSTIGGQRVQRTLALIGESDLAVIVFREWGDPEEELAATLVRSEIPYIIVQNIFSGSPTASVGNAIAVDLATAGAEQREQLLQAITAALPESSHLPPRIFGSKLSAGDIVLLVCPIDSAAPAGRLIMPQVQAIRELLDGHAIAVVVQPDQAVEMAVRLSPKMVVADSQVLALMESTLPSGTPLTSFSILLAAAKGDMEAYTKGLQSVDTLRDGDKVLICENCLHQAGCEDIGRVKIPGWLEAHTGKKLVFDFVSGSSPLPNNLADYSLIVQCGGCVATRTQIQNRIRNAKISDIPITNYGMLIRKVGGRTR